MSVLDRLGKNLQYSFYSRVIVILSSLLLTPFILNRVELGLYGLNALIISIVGYFNILDLGLTSGISRFTAKLFGEGKEKDIATILSFGIKFFLALGMLVAVSLIGLSFFYERLFEIDSQLAEKGRILLIIYGVASLFIWSMIPFRGILNGFQRVDIINKVGLTIALFNIPLAVIVLTYFKSYLLYLGLLQLLTIILSSVNILFTLKLLPDFRFNFLPIAKPLRNKIIRFSGLHFVAGIFGIIIFKIDHLIIGVILGVNSVAIYSIALSIHNHLKTLNALLGSPVYYAITSEFAKKDRAAREQMIIVATRLHSAVLIPVVIICLVSVDDFILSWVGERFSGAILPCKVLLSYWLFNITREILSHGVVGGKGKVMEAVKFESFIASANLVLSLVLIKYIGITGVALGTAIPWIVASIFYIYRYCNILSIKTLYFLNQAVTPNLPHFVLAVILSFAAQEFMDQKNVFQVLALMALVYGVTLAAGYLLLAPNYQRVIKKLVVLRA